MTINNKDRDLTAAATAVYGSSDRVLGEEQQQTQTATSARGQQSQQSPQSPQTHWVLHFDINETILVGDEAGGDTRDDSLNKALAKSAFVQIPPQPTEEGDITAWDATTKVVPTHWWDGSPIVDNDDGCNEKTSSTTPPPLYTDWMWPKGCCPYYRTAYKQRAKTFVQHHGNMYRDVYDTMQQKLSGPTTRSRGLSDHDGNDSLLFATHHPVLSHMIPAIFETLVELSSSTSKTANEDVDADANNNNPFTVVFRTFGTDLPDIAEAITEFAQGLHPDYPHFRNDKLILKPEALVRGRWVPDNNTNKYVYQLRRFSSEDDDVDNDDHNDIIASGDDEVLHFLHSHSICGIQDDYEFWSQNGWEPWAGKPIWINKNRQEYHHVLFDDNIHNLEHDSIASVRLQTTSGQYITLSGREIQNQQGLHLIRVPTIEPILNERWFLQQLSSCAERIREQEKNESESEA